MAVNRPKERRCCCCDWFLKFLTILAVTVICAWEHNRGNRRNQTLIPLLPQAAASFQTAFHRRLQHNAIKSKSLILLKSISNKVDKDFNPGTKWRSSPWVWKSKFQNMAVRLYGSHRTDEPNDHSKIAPLGSRRSGNDQDDEIAFIDDSRVSRKDIFFRFTSPVLDDPFLPLADVLVAQIVAPSLQIAWLSLNHAPVPTWLRPISTPVLFANQRGLLLAPTLIHGAALAVCWILGALAAECYQREAIVASPSAITSISDTILEGSMPWTQRLTIKIQPYQNVVARVVKAGAFATGVLMFATQLDLWTEFDFQYVQPGDDVDTDFRLYVALVEVINDVFFEGVCLLSWRLYLARQNADSLSS